MLIMEQRHRRVNPVEQMYAAFPAFLYLNASLGNAMLAPLLDAQDLSKTNEVPYAAQDLGESWYIFLALGSHR